MPAPSAVILPAPSSALCVVPPEMTITPAKAGAMLRAAEAYLAMTRTAGEAEFDLVAVEICPDGSYEVRYVANAVEVGW